MHCVVIVADATTARVVAYGPCESGNFFSLRFVPEAEESRLYSKPALLPEVSAHPEGIARVAGTASYVWLNLNNPDALSVAAGAILVVAAEEIPIYVAFLCGTRAKSVFHQSQCRVVDDQCGSIYSLLIITGSQIKFSKKRLCGGRTDFTVFHVLDVWQILGSKKGIIDSLRQHLLFRCPDIVGLGRSHFLQLQGNTTIVVA